MAGTPSPVSTGAGRGVPRRSGRQRGAVFALMDRTQAFCSAQDVYAQLRAQGNPIGLATVYRALQSMVEDGQLDVVRGKADGEALYRRCGTRHHHHLVCRVCGRAVEVEGRAVEQWAVQVAVEHGFADVEHEMDLYGTCADCAEAANGAPAAELSTTPGR